MADVDVTVHLDAIAGLDDDPEFRGYLLATAREVASAATAAAPHRTGAGAAAIRAALDVDSAVVGVDQLHAYMRFQDIGYRHAGAGGQYHAGQHFVEAALDRYARP